MRFKKSRLCIAVFTASMLAACGESENGGSSANEVAEKQAMEAEAVPALSAEEQADQWLAAMSIEQKVTLLSGQGFYVGGMPKEFDKVPGAAGYTYPVEELGIQSTVLADGPAGLRILPEREGDEQTYYATAFPVATTLSSSWDPALLEQVGQAMGREVLEYGVDFYLAPGMNVHRNPLAGRNFEYYSEDPLVSGLSAAAVVNGVESNGVGATIKHYVANNSETNRFLVDTRVNERALREIYLRGFEIAVRESQPWAVMSSYNKVNGTAVSESRDLLTDVLRDEFGFQGLVMTDWWGGEDSVAQINAGNDLLMPGDDKRTERLYEGLKSGELSEEMIDISLRRILTAVAQSPSQSGYAYSNKPDLKAHAGVARAAAAEGAVLLKNEGDALPFGADVKKVAAFGVTSYDFISGGTGSGDVNEAYTVSLVDGMEGAGLDIEDSLTTVYRAYIDEQKALLPELENAFMLPPPIPEMPVTDVLANAAAETDIALITIGRNSGEFQDRSVAGDFDLTAAELQMLNEVSGAFRAAGKKVIVVLNIGNVIETASWRDLADAIVLPWQGGQEAGNAVADLLTGKVNPSGHLATTFPVRYSDVPSSAEVNFPGVKTSDEIKSGVGGFQQGNPSMIEYNDGIYVGYRYYETFDVEVAYPFGFGLSYTTFDVSAASEITLDGELYSVDVKVTNTGEVAGKQVVQAYVSAPQGRLPKPAKELRAYAKTGLLAPGASETLTLSFTARDIASFDESARAWVAEAGEYTVTIGTSLKDAAATLGFSRDTESSFQPATVDLRREEPVAEIR